MHPCSTGARGSRSAGSILEERAGAATAEDLARLDVCWSIGHALQSVDLVRGADFQARHLLYALDAGEPGRVARALASEAILAAMEGGRRGLDRAPRLVEQAHAAAERSGAPHAIAWAARAAAGVAFHAPRFSEAVALAHRAVELFRKTCTGVVWDIGSIVADWLLPALFHLGRLDDLAARLPAHLKEAEDLGALALSTSLRALAAPRILLVNDRPSEARREAVDAIRRWPSRAFHLPHWYALLTRATASLYEGDGMGAHADVEGCWSELEDSPLLRVESVRVEALALRGASAIAAAALGSDGEYALRVAERSRRALGREPSAFARPFAAELGAAIALARGNDARALALYEEAERAFGSLEMGLHAAAARRRRGEIASSDEGRSLLEGADAWMSDRGIARPDRIAAMLSPAPIGPL
ncbi:MAG: hypothetical protein QM820_58015 [Minicystis sp.]